MNATHAKGLMPRKTPRQARSVVTVDAIFEATIQVLLSHGLQRLTTTRVADRAGVSVGTLYQYYPNKQSLLYAVLGHHLDRVVESVEQACGRHHHEPLAMMVPPLIQAYVDAKTARLDEANALNLVAAELNSADLIAQASKRVRSAILSMLATASDARFDDLNIVSFMVHAAMAGPTRSALESGAPSKILRALHEHLTMLCHAYLSRVAIPDGIEQR